MSRKAIFQSITPFTGPLFITGMPRSGTKLLRELLNAHENVRILEIETEFLPYWVSKWSTFGDLSDPRQFEEFFRDCQRLPFFIYLRERHSTLSADNWFARCREFTPAAVFEALVAVALEVSSDDQVIWGDKSPSYLTHMPLLKLLFPQARFIHIIRDVRDYCLSINKAWGKNMIRAAQRWADDVATASSAGSSLGDSYLEIKYEALLDNPELTLCTVCNFLSIPFTNDILELSRPTENLGDTKDVPRIVRSNTGKFRQAMAPRTRRRIEQLTWETLIASGYDCKAYGTRARIGRTQLLIYQILDGINLIRFATRERGIRGAMSFVYRYFTTSGNRQALSND